MVSSSRKITPKVLHLDRLPQATREAFLSFASFDFLKSPGWYLAGGTALSLQVGHRQSVDLDFFLEKKSFQETRIERILLEKGEWETVLKQKGTLYGIFNDAKVSFIAYPFFRPSSSFFQCGTVKIILPDDIAAMKIVAVSQRGRKRDFVDLYWYCNYCGLLDETIQRAISQYPDQKRSLPHFLKSLVYFADAEDDPMPKLFFKADWKTVKAYFRREVPIIARRLLRL
ncbi:MAG: hypothetical protein A2934_01550 [Candidatus Sungbacteria bacterium RIFCSPLOWO2_01_FULL_47_10]|uniref:Nucleotidyl transferase AbiEii/AbiGii toxin family protein n=1 Tax=Candidatus Sungbacteria bacterium RIFCSPLOWO2_01_FULL_47_10 TaxID=1802276 RepID=A0A1G2L814_9BACT|nr:MAG: hypothetical protein A2934_01550 [Candidatus Sungbacteria bacterium RIFCSPLOWO2_01_FULL_47_10]